MSHTNEKLTAGQDSDISIGKEKEGSSYEDVQTNDSTGAIHAGLGLDKRNANSEEVQASAGAEEDECVQIDAIQNGGASPSIIICDSAVPAATHQSESAVANTVGTDATVPYIVIDDDSTPVETQEGMLMLSLITLNKEVSGLTLGQNAKRPSSMF